MVRDLSRVAQTAMLVALTAGWLAAPAAAEVPQSIGPPLKPSSELPPLQLSDAQRARITDVVGHQDTDVSFALKQAKKAQSFQPAVGEKLPSGLKPLALPWPLTQEMPVLKRYTYLKFKGHVLLVNAMQRKIVAVLPISKG